MDLCCHIYLGSSFVVRVVDLNEEREWRLQGSLQLLHELSCTKTVDDTVVAGQAHLHDGADDDLTVAYDGHFLRPCYGEDSGVRLVDDRGEGLDTIHTQIGDGEGATFLILRRKLLANSTLVMSLRRSIRSTRPSFSAP